MKQIKLEHQKVRENFFGRKKFVAKKNTEVYPYTCEPHIDWKDLGQDHYPKYINTVLCNTADCANFRLCRTTQYPVRVLRKLTEGEVISESDRVKLPPELQDPIPDKFNNAPVQFTFANIPVNVSCECTERN